MVTFGLYPWHSTAVTASMRPDPGVVASSSGSRSGSSMRRLPLFYALSDGIAFVRASEIW